MTTYHYEDSPQLCQQLQDAGERVSAKRLRERRGHGSLQYLQEDLATWQRHQEEALQHPSERYSPPLPDQGEVARRVAQMRAQCWLERADADYARLAQRLAPAGPAPMPTVDHAAFGAYIGRKMRGEPTHGRSVEPTDAA